MWSLRQSGGIQLPHLTVTEVKFGMLTENPNLDLVIRTVSLQGGGEYSQNNADISNLHNV